MKKNNRPYDKQAASCIPDPAIKPANLGSQKEFSYLGHFAQSKYVQEGHNTSEKFKWNAEKGYAYGTLPSGKILFTDSGPSFMAKYDQDMEEMKAKQAQDDASKNPTNKEE